MTKLVPGVHEFALLQPLQWNTRYSVEITARNIKGLSEPTYFQFLMPQKPDITGMRWSTLVCVCVCVCMCVCDVRVLKCVEYVSLMSSPSMVLMLNS